MQLRRYFSPTFNSAFLGLYFKYADIKVTVNIKEDQIVWQEMRLINGGANFGRKWIWKNGLTLTARIGYGFGLNDVNVTGQNVPEDQLKLNRFFTKLFAPLDSELSVGYSF